MKRFVLPLLAAIITSTSLLAMETSGGDISLIPPPPPKPKILNIPFGAPRQQVVKQLIQQGLEVIDTESIGVRGASKIVVLKGIPSGVVLRQGTTRCHFFKNQLVRMSFHFDATYRNFLTLRSQLFNSMGERYMISERQELMDSLLRARLASLQHDEFNTRAESLIKDSIIEGKTLFYYQLDDNKKQFEITCAFKADQSSIENDPAPTLSIHYNYLDGMKQFAEFESGEPAIGGYKNLLGE